jgi:hypothetical protein
MTSLLQVDPKDLPDIVDRIQADAHLLALSAKFRAAQLRAVEHSRQAERLEAEASSAYRRLLAAILAHSNPEQIESAVETLTV